MLDERQRLGIRAGGAGLAAALLDGAVQSGVRVLPGTRLVDVWTGPGGSVTGADLADAGGVRTHSAAAVILATGGFDWNEGLRAQMLPRPLIAFGAPPTNTGDALRIAVGLGAEVGNTSECWWMPMVAVPGETLDGMPYYRSLIRERALPRQIMINDAGRRFADEALPYDEIGKAMLHPGPDGSYPNGAAWMIFDEGFRRSFPVASISPGQPVPGWVMRAGSVSGLAARIAVDDTVLEETIARWNRDCSAGTDSQFGRGNTPYERYMGDRGTSPHPNLGPIDQPPYYAVRVLAGTIGTKGGPVLTLTPVCSPPPGHPFPACTRLVMPPRSGLPMAIRDREPPWLSP